jgi:hypothetical protein
MRKIEDLGIVSREKICYWGKRECFVRFGKNEGKNI